MPPAIRCSRRILCAFEAEIFHRALEAERLCRVDVVDLLREEQFEHGPGAVAAPGERLPGRCGRGHRSPSGRACRANIACSRRGVSEWSWCVVLWVCGRSVVVRVGGKR